MSELERARRAARDVSKLRTAAVGAPFASKATAFTMMPGFSVNGVV